MEIKNIVIFLLSVSIIGLCIFFLFPKEQIETEFDAQSTLNNLLENTKTNDFLAIEASITNIMKEKGLHAGFLLIDEAEKQGIITNDQCHALLHYVGHEGYAENPYDYEKLTSIVEGTSCIGGFIHGIEAEIVLTSDNLKEDVWDFCTYAKQKGVSPGPCYHGVGHAATELYNYDIKKALALCDSLAGGPEDDLSNCYRGIFSEVGNVIIGVDGHTGLAIESINVEGLGQANPFNFCETLEERHQSSCKSQLLKIIANDVDIEDWFTICANPDFSEQSQLICANILSAVYVRETLSFKDTTTLPEEVNLLPEKVRRISVFGAIEAFSGYAIDGQTKDWESFCENSYSQESDTAYCKEAFTGWVERGETPWMERDDIR